LAVPISLRFKNRESKKRNNEKRRMEAMEAEDSRLDSVFCIQFASKKFHWGNINKNKGKDLFREILGKVAGRKEQDKTAAHALHNASRQANFTCKIQ
jgi:hypothetical protein